MRLLLVFLGFLLSTQVSANNTWQWLHPCQLDNNKTECTVWFNQLETFGQIKVKTNNQLLAVQQQSFVQTRSASANALLVHLQDVTPAQLQEVQKGLNTLLDRQQSFQKLALYETGNSLQMLAPLGATKSQLKQAISSLKRNATVSKPINDLQAVIDILGSSAEQRRVVYWLTIGTNVSAAQLAQVKQKLAQEKVRLVVLNLARSELERNSFPGLSRLVSAVTGVYANLSSNQWAASIAKLADYSNNGVRLSLDTRSLCGAKKLKFTAQFSGIATQTETAMTYPACARVLAPAPAGNTTAAENTAIETDASETTPAPVSSEVPATSEIPAGTEPTETSAEIPPVTAPAETNTESTNTQTGGTSTTDPNQAPVVISADKPAINWLPWGVGGLILLLLALLLLMLKNRKQAETPAAVESAPNIYGYLLVPSIDGIQRIALDKASSKMGRSQENDVVFNDDTVSGIHAQIKFERNGDVVLVDLQSSNGTYVNGEEVMQQTLQVGDDITLGSYQFKFGG